MELLRPILELGVVIPGMLLCLLPGKIQLKNSRCQKLVLWLVPLLALLCAARRGVLCAPPICADAAGLTLLAVVIYIKTLRISLWKSGTIALSVCAVFACINSLCRAINAAMLAGLPQAQAAPWFCLRSAICYHAICWLFAAIAYYPATHSVRRMVEDENFAQTWYVFWVLPLVFIALNLFMIPMRTRSIPGVFCRVFCDQHHTFVLMLFFNNLLLMAISINGNVRLQQENQLLSMQQQRYESLKAAIEKPGRRGHDLRHQLCQLAALAEEGNLEKIKSLSFQRSFQNPGVWSCISVKTGRQTAWSGITAHLRSGSRSHFPADDLPETSSSRRDRSVPGPLESAGECAEASLRTAPARRRIEHRLSAWQQSGADSG